MSIRILRGGESFGSDERACLFESTTEWAFGPVFRAAEDGTSAADVAEQFLAWVVGERGLSNKILPPGDELAHLYDEFITGREG